MRLLRKTGQKDGLLGQSILNIEKTNLKLQIPPQAEKIIRILEDAGYEAYVVGGCVRDCVLGRTPNDWDITTSAPPERVKELFHRTVDTGIQHGTVTVLMGHESYEVTTYRVDGLYEDCRHPKKVTFTGELREDLCRRDFTINAMAYHPVRGLVDLFGGADDIASGVIRCVGDPEERFSEDALRMLRALRFSAQLGFSVEEGTREAIRHKAETLQHISAERIQAELVKILVSPHPDILRDAYSLGVTKVFLPEFDVCMETEQNTPHHCYTVGEHILHALLLIPEDRILRLSILLHDIGKPAVKTTDPDGRDHFKMHPVVGEKMAETILRRLKFDNDTIHTVCRLVLYHDVRPKGNMTSVRKAVNRIGEDLFPSFLLIQNADIRAQSMYLRKEKLGGLGEVSACYQEIVRLNQCLSLKDLAVTGRDLIGEGIRPGKEMGQLLAALLEHVLEAPEDNVREVLLDLVRCPEKLEKPR